ncbi:hypothetical protein [Desulfofustis glycolicus]|nr:hypothetical protein [Desulfofustis glycolicus]MCB2217099.1 hypothetical protein [Desulfobulbaceae bacterium]
MIAAAAQAAEQTLQRKMLCFLLLAVFALSSYSFIVVGLDGIAQIA